MRALLSVYDKSGIVDFARQLHELDVELISSGGTAKVIAEAGIPVTDVADITGVPAILGHRVVTLHPKVHGGILADRNDAEHRADMETYGIEGIDLVVVNLYPFSSDPSIELIDIGGPAMVRASAKNHAFVGVVTDPGQYPKVLADLTETGALRDSTRKELALAAFRRTAAYDAQIVEWLSDQVEGGASAGSDGDVDADTVARLPETIEVTLSRQQVLRYGENPHQVGARYVTRSSSLGGPPGSDATGGWWDTATQHGGKEMSYLNVYDADAAWRLAWSLGEQPSAAVIKHANPCGVAIAEDILAAYTKAHECDPVSAFGGIVAVNRPVTLAMAEALAPVFTEVLIAPSYEPDALVKLLEKRNLRVLEAAPPSPLVPTLRNVDGGFLVQTPDLVTVDRSSWQVVTDASPTDAQWADLELAWRVVAKVTSNAIVLVNDGQAVGIGCGQQNRRDAGKIAGEKAEGRAKGGAYASDAFFPFADGLDGALDAGASTVIQPGGSIRDEEVIARANELGLAMVFTGERHFRH